MTSAPRPLRLIVVSHPCQYCGSECNAPPVCDRCRTLTPEEQARIQNINASVAKRTESDPTRHDTAAAWFADSERRTARGARG